ncbi:MAG: B12-binding domain-containing radical SAM protein [Nanoarchaeota archaeon]|nr:B12-binding domain-containing radical SAM protein [Nanoarchaeota archaeon]
MGIKDIENFKEKSKFSKKDFEGRKDSKSSIDMLLVIPVREEENHYIVPPLGLGYLATALRKEKFSVDILDCSREGLDYKGFEKRIRKLNPKIIGIQVFSYDVNPVKKAIKIIKKIDSEIKIILGGAHPTSEPNEIFNQFPEIDYAFKGESEEGLPMIVNYLLKNKEVNFSKVPGLIWKEGKKIIINEQTYDVDLDKYGFPAWDLINPKLYKNAAQGGLVGSEKYAPMTTSRGCPFQCTYCTVHIMSGRRIRYRSVKHVIDEMKLLKDEFGVDEIHIIDDAFTTNKARVHEFCDELIKQKMNIKFTFPNGIRLDTLDKEILLKMKKAGLQDFNVGIESGSDKILKDMKKSLTTKIIEEKTKLIKECGLNANGFFIIGYPTETREDILKTIKFSKKIPLKKAQFSMFKTYPNTEITNKLIEEGKLEELDYDNFIFYKVGYVPEGLTAKEMKKLQRKAFLGFYLRPKILWGMLKDINSFEQIKFIAKRVWYSLFVSK